MLASFHHISPISSTEELVLPPQLVLSDEKSGGATVQQSLYGIALNKESCNKNTAFFSLRNKSGTKAWKIAFLVRHCRKKI